MPDKHSDNLERPRNVVSIIVGIVTLVGVIASVMFSNRLDSTDSRVTGVQVELRTHKDNTAIHRTAEEGRAWERGEQAKWELLMDRLQSIDKRLEKLEARP